MIDLTRIVCNCNQVTAQEAVDFIKKYTITDLDVLVENDELEMGNVCESCQVDGFDGDGFSLSMLLEAVKKGEV